MSGADYSPEAPPLVSRPKPRSPSPVWSDWVHIASFVGVTVADGRNSYLLLQATDAGLVGRPLTNSP